MLALGMGRDHGIHDLASVHVTTIEGSVLGIHFQVREYTMPLEMIQAQSFHSRDLNFPCGIGPIRFLLDELS